MNDFFEATMPLWPVVIGFSILAISGFTMIRANSKYRKSSSRIIRMQQEHIKLLESDRFAGADSLGRPPFWKN